MVKDGTGIVAYGMVAGGGAFGDAKLMWQTGAIAFSDVNPFGVDVNPDGLGDLGLLRKAGSNTALMWLRATQTGNVVTFAPTTVYTDANLSWAPTTTKAY